MYIFTCDCKQAYLKGKKVKGECSKWVVPTFGDDQCLYCRHIAVAHYVPRKWKPEFGFKRLYIKQAMFAKEKNDSIRMN